MPDFITERTKARDIRGAIEVTLCFALGVLLLWKGILPAWKTLNTDFPNYYLVARLMREHYSLDQVYDWIWLQRIKDHWGIPQSLVGFAGLTPPSAWPVLPLTFFSPLTAKRIWIVLNLGMLAMSVELMVRAAGLRRRFVWLMCLFAIIPLRTSFLFGQMHLIVLLALVLAWFFARRGNDVASGIFIAVAGALKIYPLLLVGYFVLRRRWKALLSTITAVGAIIAISILVMGHEMLRSFVFEQLPRTLQGEVMDPYSNVFASGASLFHRLLLVEPQLNPSPLIDLPVLYTVLYPLWQTIVVAPLLILLLPCRQTRDRELENTEWAAFLMGLLTLTPVPSTYHFVVMILPVMLLLDSLLRKRAIRRMGIVLFLYACVGMLGAANLRFPPSMRFWLVSALYLCALEWLWHLRGERELPPRMKDLTLTLALSFCGVAVSVVGYCHHFSYRDMQLHGRVALQNPTLLATNPVSAPQGFYYIAMGSQGYRVVRQRADDPVRVVSDSSNADQLSLAIDKKGTLLIEVADDNGSRIVRAVDGSVLVRDAESPALSPDGKRLAFLRERKGRGTLYLSEMSDGTGALPITNADYDVRQVSILDDGELIFAAKYKGRRSLFQVSKEHAVNPFLAPKEEIADFSVSPDGNRIAFTESVRHRWQLAVLDARRGKTIMLTDFDCNAYRPAWIRSDEIIYATDCARGLGLTALATIAVPTE